LSPTIYDADHGPRHHTARSGGKTLDGSVFRRRAAGESRSIELARYRWVVLLRYDDDTVMVVARGLGKKRHQQKNKS
jgi:hypothetical protein